MKIGNTNVESTRDVLSKDTKLAMMIWATSGMGKTQLAGSLDRLTTKHNGKRTLFIGVESGAGGGTATLKDLDIPLVVPKDWKECDSILSALKNDKEFGGVVVDSATELVKQFIKPRALQYAPRERSEVVLGPRGEGVPAESDYMVMGEMTRQVLQTLLNISSHPDLSIRKHVIITALDRMKVGRGKEDKDQLLYWGPNLPGAMGPESAGMFQVVGTLVTKAAVIGGTRQVLRYLQTSTDGVKALKDRWKIFPPEMRLKTSPSDTEGLDLCDVWEKYWLPAVAARAAAAPLVAPAS